MRKNQFDHFYIHKHGTEEYCSLLPREERLKELEMAWDAYGGRLFFIGGGAGVGKSGLARTYAMKHGGHCAEGSLFEEPMLLSEEELGHEDMVLCEGEKLAFSFRQGVDYRTIQQKPTLLILHVNYDRPDLEKIKEYLDEMLPCETTHEGTRILVTVRFTGQADDVYVLPRDKEFARQLYEVHQQNTTKLVWRVEQNNELGRNDHIHLNGETSSNSAMGRYDKTGQNDETKQNGVLNRNNKIDTSSERDRVLSLTGYRPWAVKLLSVFRDRTKPWERNIVETLLAKYSVENRGTELDDAQIRDMLRKTLLESRDFTEEEIDLMHFMSLFPERAVQKCVIVGALGGAEAELFSRMERLLSMGFVRWKPDTVFRGAVESNVAVLNDGYFEIGRSEAGILEDFLWKNGYVDTEGERCFIERIFGNLMGRLSAEDCRIQKYMIRPLMQRLEETAAVVYYTLCGTSKSEREIAVQKLVLLDTGSQYSELPETVVVRAEYHDRGCLVGLHSLESGSLPRGIHDLGKQVRAEDILCMTEDLDFDYLNYAGADRVEYVAFLWRGKDGEREQVWFHQPERLCGVHVSKIWSHFIVCHDNFRLASIRFSQDLFSIGEKAFCGCRMSGKLTLPDGLRVISDEAFSCCTGFRGDLVIPEKVDYIGEYAFSHTTFDGELVLPARPIEIHEGAFAYCRDLKGKVTLHLMEGCDREFVPYIFYDTEQVEVTVAEETRQADSLQPWIDTVSENMTTWRDTCLSMTVETAAETQKKVALKEKVPLKLQGQWPEFPAALEEIRDWAFYEEDKLTGELALPEALRRMGRAAFFGCSGLTGLLRIPAGVRQIHEETFCHCERLEGLTLSEGLESIGAMAFGGCRKLSGKLVLPKSAKTVRPYAFYECGFETVTFLNPETQIGQENFLPAVTRIRGYKHSTAEQYAQEYGFVFEQIDNRNT